MKYYQLEYKSSVQKDKHGSWIVILRTSIICCDNISEAITQSSKILKTKYASCLPVTLVNWRCVDSKPANYSDNEPIDFWTKHFPLEIKEKECLLRSCKIQLMYKNRIYKFLAIARTFEHVANCSQTDPDDMCNWVTYWSMVPLALQDILDHEIEFNEIKYISHELGPILDSADPDLYFIECTEVFANEI